MAAGRTETSIPVLDQIAELYDRGLYLQAKQASEPLGPLDQWEGTDARVLAGRLANNLGGQRLGSVLHRLAWRADPDHPRACYFYLLSALPRRGPLKTWRHLQSVGPLPEAEPGFRADWCALHAQVLALLRDFENADRWIAQALELAPERPWILLEQSFVLDLQDQHDAALEAAQQALTIRPFYRPAVQMTAYRLIQLNRDDEALALLEDAVERLESGDLLCQLATLQTELQRYQAARRTLERVTDYYPLLDYDRGRKQWLAAQKADIACLLGEFEEAATLAKEVDSPFYQQLAERISASGMADRKRKLLPVSFVRQHHATCAPATLSAISHYWSRPVDHLEIAAAICYDGTPAHNERRWAEEAGFHAREFRVTWESSMALIDAGIPFTLTTVDPGSAHLQAVVGYDSRRGTLLIRDPSERHLSEFLSDKMLEHYSSSGPRGMVMVPADEAARLDQLDLPEAEFYDWYYGIEQALEKHERARAARFHEQMRERDPGHRLTLRARATLAHYDGDLVALLRATEQLLALFPKDANLLFAKLNCLRELGRREERLKLYKEICENLDCDPLFFCPYAEELSVDARQAPRVRALARRALRRRPADGRAYSLLGQLAWENQQHLEAVQLYRFAACLDDKNEGQAKCYFQAARHVRQTDVALDYLKDRFQRFGRQSSWPARTLCWGYELLDDVGTAFLTIEKALELRPDDGELRLFAADLHARYGKTERSQQYLNEARAVSHPQQWQRAAALLASYSSDLPEALEHWYEVARADPLSVEAHDHIARLLADLKGSEAAIEHLREAVARFPHRYALRGLLVDWLRNGDPAEAERELHELLDAHPADPWARREMAIMLWRLGKYEESRQEAELAKELEPGSPVVYLILGRIDEALGNVASAKNHYREGIRQSIDHDDAIASLIRACDTKREREEELEFVYEQLQTQVTYGDGLLSFRDHAHGTFAAPRLLEILRVALDARPDLWHAWSAVIRQLAEMGEYREAWRVAREAVGRFPLLPRLWLDLAVVSQRAEDFDEQIRALEQALEISPDWSDAVRMLADAWQQAGQPHKALGILEDAVRGNPRDPMLRASLASTLWEQEQYDRALDELARTVADEPGFSSGWAQLQQWCMQRDCPDRVIELARELTRRRPHEARSWLILADALDDPEHREECFAALDEVITRNPRHVQAWSLRAWYLSVDGRFEEALAACEPAAWEGELPPLELQARAADIQFQRGRPDLAIPQMQQVLERDPEYTWAWSRLAEWLADQDDARAYLHAAENLVRLAPDMEASYGYRGDARLRTQDRQGAKEDFLYSITLAPHYQYGADCLLQMCLEDEQWGEAEEILQRLAPHQPPDLVLGFQSRLASLQQDRDTAARTLAALAQTPGPGFHLEAAVQGMLQNEWDHTALRVLEEQLGHADAGPAVGDLWMRVLMRTVSSPESCVRALRSRPEREELWKAAALPLIHFAGQKGLVAVVKQLQKRFWSRLFEDDDLWAAIGDALCDLNVNALVLQWMRGQEHRPSNTPSRLFPLVLALWETRQVDEATVVNRLCLQLPPDHTTPYHALWSAFAALLDNDELRMLDDLRSVDRESLTDFYQDLYDLLVCVRRVLPEGEAGVNSWSRARRAYEETWQRCRPVMTDDMLGKRLRKLMLAKLAQEHGNSMAARFHRLSARLK